ncbi:hypothetical protein [Qipengyuania spongiae]|uniref:Uncharacterized protein n=1 Tax=Qipengyuania spongiae TaxID=2909673 RepID=A0ABY5T133_9SPHN|nr:hypothetical protein [Qipengyuania spongiae]UVI38644.1 hypothetical protein L1F33_10325 [Qipengyuania spongiae]
MKTLLAAGAAISLALGTAPAIAQSDEMPMTAQQQTMYDAWPADRQSSYDAWPMEAKTYFWTLNDQQKSGWWVLNDEQRMRIIGMTPQQRTAAWTSIMNQMSGTAATATTAAPAGSATATTGARTNQAAAGGMASTSGAMRFVSSERVQPTPDDQGPPSGDVPICTANQQDNCINSWEARKTGNRPLEQWPGRPASEMD